MPSKCRTEQNRSAEHEPLKAPTVQPDTKLLCSSSQRLTCTVCRFSHAAEAALEKVHTSPPSSPEGDHVSTKFGSKRLESGQPGCWSFVETVSQDRHYGAHRSNSALRGRPSNYNDTILPIHVVDVRPATRCTRISRFVACSTFNIDF